ncbi:hypothetical protein D3C72_1294530 [compost metagenome]
MRGATQEVRQCIVDSISQSLIFQTHGKCRQAGEIPVARGIRRDEFEYASLCSCDQKMQRYERKHKNICKACSNCARRCSRVRKGLNLRFRQCCFMCQLLLDGAVDNGQLHGRLRCYVA